MPVFTSPDGPVSVRDCSITEMVLEGLSGRPDEPAAIDGPTGRIVTRRDLADSIKALAGGLTRHGHAPGKVIALIAPNIPEFATVFHGIAWAGSIVTTVNPACTAEEINHQLSASGAVLLVTIPQLMETSRQAVIGTDVAEIVVIGEADGATPLVHLMGPPLDRQAPVDLANDTVVLPYSSGTTGLPKGVMLTHRNLVANLCQIAPGCNVQPGERTPAFLPFFHIYGMEVLVNLYLHRGACLVTMPRFDLELFLRLIQEHRCQKLWVVPPVGIALAKHPMVDNFDLSSLSQIMTAAAPMGADMTEAIRARLGCHVFQGYGMTELSPVSHFSTVARQRPGAAGVTVPGTEARIRDPNTGTDLGPGQEGELLVRGPQVMKGYLNNPKATADTIDAEGWLHTGDIAAIDEDGYLFIRDRLKELIKVKGFQVAPAEVEAALLTHPSIRDVAVIGIPDDEAGEVPMAFVVPEARAEVTLAMIQQYLTGHLSRYKLPQALKLIEAVPKSASGKILRRMLRPKEPVAG